MSGSLNFKYYAAIIKPYLTGIAIIVVGTLSYMGLRAYKNHLVANETVLQQENKEAKDKIIALTKEYEQLKIAKNKVDADNVRLTNAMDIAVKKANSDVVIPAPPNPPTDDLVIVSELKEAGITFKPLTDKVYSTDHTSLPIVWTWNREAIRVPSLETKILDTQAALASSSNLIEGLNKKITISDKMVSDADAREELRKIQEINFNKQLKDKNKQIVVAEVNGWVKVAITVPVVYGITRALHK